jgi:large subunit ribosomal protein L25
MAKAIKLSAKVRDRAAKVVRRVSAIPGVVYGHKAPATSIEVDQVEFLKVFGQAGETSLISLDLGDGPERNVLVRDIQLHPVHGNVIHVDFFQVRLDEVIQANVPIEFVGVAPAVKDLGGIFVHPMDEISLEALPQNLPHTIEVDISGLINFEKVIHISDLKAGEGITFLHEPDEVVALVQEAKSQEELDAELSAEVKEDVENVEGVADKPEAEEGEAPATAEAEDKKE